MNRVIHFEIQADNVERAIKFYESVFGWETSQMMTEEQGDINYWSIKTGNGEFGINGGMYERPRQDKHNLFDCIVGVADIDQAVAAVKKNGGRIEREKTEIKGVGWLARVCDTEGNRLGLMQSTVTK